jgi:hypothetical protein
MGQDMAEPIPQTIEELGDRSFSFYPAILNIEHNEWTLKQLSWSEVLVANSQTAEEVWIPRRFVGEVASADHPVTIVGLKKELEFKAGAVWPHDRRLLSMPRGKARNYVPIPQRSGEPPPPGARHRRVVGPEGKVGRLIVGALVTGFTIILVVLAMNLRSVSLRGVEEHALGLTFEDDYNSVVRKLGKPTEDRWRANTGEMQYRLLRFKGKPYALILMGTEQDTARYIGAMDGNWKPVDSVPLPRGGDTRPMLRKLPKF